MKELAIVLAGIVFVAGVFTVVRFLVYAAEHSPTARRGKYSCYASRGGKLCMRPISAERARAGRDCEACESVTSDTALRSSRDELVPVSVDPVELLNPVFKARKPLGSSSVGGHVSEQGSDNGDR